MSSDGDQLRQPPVTGVESENEVVVVHLAGELDVSNAGEVKAALREAGDHGRDRLVVDLAGVSFVDSAALAVLIDARRRQQAHGSFHLAAPGHEVRRALAISGLDRQLAVHDSVEDALTASA